MQDRCTHRPFISPTQVEFKKWCPAFKLLTYFGSAKERKAKRQGWSKPNAFHVVITSYTLILQVPTRCIKWNCRAASLLCHYLQPTPLRT